MNLVVGIISFPISCFFFKKLSDRGYALAHLIGWFGISYISFFSSHLGIPVYYTKYLAFVIWLVVNLILEVKYRFLRNNLTLSNVLINQGIFLFFFLFWYFARIGDFKLNTIERTPDFGIIKSLFNTSTLPPVDVWLAGKSINYYYFGHYVAFIIMSLSGIDAIAGFFLLIPWMFGIYALCLYRFGKDLFSFSVPRGNYFSIVSGAASVFFVLFAGNLYAVKYLWAKGFWYPEPTRFITGTITEIPFYSFIISDLHAHVWGLGIGIIILITLLCFWFDKKSILLYRNPYIYLLAFLLGLTLITNTWDMLSLGLLSGIVVCFKYFKQPLTLKDALGVLFNLLIILSVSIFWFASYRQEGGMGLGIVNNWSGLWNLFLNWGGFVIPGLLFLAIYGSKSFKEHRFVYIVYAVSLLFIVFTEIFYVKDVMSEGPYQRANTVFKVYMQVWLWLGAVSGAVFTMVLFPTLSRLNKNVAHVFHFVALTFVISLASYPLMTSKQTVIPKFTRSIYSGMDFFSQSYPDDYKAFLFLKNIEESLSANDRGRIIVEAPGESFKDENLFSSYLGWPTILGWGGHVWTYRGTSSYLDERNTELDEIYNGADIAPTVRILKKYNVDYIIVGTVEKRKFPNLNKTKLFSLGNVIYDKGGVAIIEISETTSNPYQSVPPTIYR